MQEGERNAFFYLTIFVGVIQSLLAVLFAISIKILVNNAEYKLPTEKLISSSIFVVIIVILSFVFNVLYKIFSSKNAVLVEKSLKKGIFKSFVDGNYFRLSNVFKGDVVSKLEADSLAVSNIYANLIPNVISTILHLLFILVVLLILQPLYTALILGCSIIAVILTFAVKKAFTSLYNKTRSKNSEVSVFTSETVENALVVKAFDAEEHIQNKFNNKVDKYQTARLKYMYCGATISSITNLLFTMFYSSSVILGVIGIYNGVSGVDFGVMIAILQLIMQIKSPVTTLSGAISSHAEMKVSFNRLERLDFSSDKVIKTKVLKDDFNYVKLDAVNFSYDNETVVENVNLKINKGDRVLIKGSSGEGKSTLLKILSGLYSVDSGSVKVALNDKEISLNETSSLFSYVPQENMLFSGSIRENIAFNSNVTDEDIIKALKLCEVDFIESDKNGLNTLIGEGGNGLSIGQIQRLAIARALVSNRPIMILDEATSALDSATESRIVENLSKIKDATIIIVSHRECFDSIATSVYLMKDKNLSPFINWNKSEY